MILPDFVLPSRVNQCWNFSGIDSPEHCLDLEHFKNFPFQVEYRYNNRGFRDDEWPDNLADAIWCLGDSFTAGIGSPRDHTWPVVLQQHTKKRTINVSMDGASNNWIAKKARRILEEIVPRFMVIQWSYISRREQDREERIQQSWQDHYDSIADPDWPTCHWRDRDKLPLHIQLELNQKHAPWNETLVSEEDLRLMCINSTTEEDIDNTISCIESVNNINSKTQVVHGFVPKFAPEGYSQQIMTKINGSIIPEILILDRARDGCHYGIKTSQAFVGQLKQYLCQ